MAEIATGEKITDNYVSNLIHLAWLSPDFVNQVLEGEPAAIELGAGRDAHP
jgi:site-specific DNA recombinase